MRIYLNTPSGSMSTSVTWSMADWFSYAQAYYAGGGVGVDGVGAGIFTDLHCPQPTV